MHQSLKRSGEKLNTSVVEPPAPPQRTFFDHNWPSNLNPKSESAEKFHEGCKWTQPLDEGAALTPQSQALIRERSESPPAENPKQLLLSFHPSEHVIDPQNFERTFLDEMCSLATEVRALAKSREGRIGLKELLCDRRAMLYFTQPSTRTFLSFDNACHILGIRTSEIRDPSTSSEVKGESLEDSIRTFSSYVDIIIMRSAEPGLAARAARLMNLIGRRVPIVNAGSGPDQHPTQALLDIYTLQRGFEKRGGIEGKTIGMMGDLARGRTVRSLCHLLCKYQGVRIKFISPKEFGMKSDVKDLLDKRGIEFEDTKHVDNVLPELDALYLTRLQTEYDRPGSVVRFDHTRYQIGLERVRKMKPDALVMHPLPRGPELDPLVDDDRRAMYWQQERNGMWVRVALLIQLFKAKADFDKLSQELCP